ncbi:MAG: two-component sensor histidine kinase [Myxococcales bacterium]|nr:two-component sensor histidine kinase [Myxococcales bacterium]
MSAEPTAVEELMASGDENEGHDVDMAPSARRALIALGVVVAISLAMIGGTLVMAKHTTDRAHALTESSLRSAQLVDDLRHEIHHLEGVPPDARSSIEQRIVAALVAYRPLATGPGEAAELSRLEQQLDAFLPAAATAPDRAARLEQLEGSLERLSESNLRVARWKVARIDRAQRDGLVAQFLATLITLICVGVVATVLSRVMRRQRSLIRSNLESLEVRNRELAEFARRTAHDLRQPLSPIRGYADLLAEGALVDVKHAASKIRTASNTMAEIIENLLALSVTGHLPAGVASVPPLVRSILDDLHTELADAAVRTEIEDCKVACAPSVLGQLLHNVLTNASKYRDRGRPLQVEITARVLGPEIELKVADNGIGMTPEAVAHAFDPAYRASTDGTVAGHGLGLAIVKRAIDAIGGSCSLTSQADRGSEIVMRLPAAS